VITHVVMFKFKDPTAENLTRCKALLDGLPPDIEQIENFDVGIDVLRSERSWDLVLVSTFDDLDALERYRAHPRHEAVARHLVEASEVRASVDFEN
jgi:hypothetical protein